MLVIVSLLVHDNIICMRTTHRHTYAQRRQNTNILWSSANTYKITPTLCNGYRIAFCLQRFEPNKTIYKDKFLVADAGCEFLEQY